MVDSVRNKLKILKIVLWSILGAILLFIFIVVGTLLVDKYSKKSPVPMFAGYGIMIVISPSMSGTINKGDMIIVKRMDEYHLGEIVTYILPNGMANTHRLVNYADESHTTFITKGDDVTDVDQVLDPPVTLDDIRGKVVGTIPKVGVFFDWVMHDGGIIYILSLIAVIIAGVFFLNMTKSDSNEEAEATADASAAGDGTADNPAVLTEADANNSAATEEKTETNPEEAGQPDEASSKENN